jgi:site-specific recombinase XerD
MEIAALLQGYQLCAATEGKSLRSIEIVTQSVRYFREFLLAHGASTDAAAIGPQEIRAFIFYLQQKPRYSNHPLTPVQDQLLSEHSVNCYVRSVRVFFSWLVSEEIIAAHPFERVKIPKVSKKIMPTFSAPQIQLLLDAMDTGNAQGQRNYTIILTLLDTGLRISELLGLQLADLQLNDGVLKVLGKGNKERLIPIGKQVQRLLWHYINHCRPVPARPKGDFLFLTDDGHPLTRGRVEKIMTVKGRKAGLAGIRCSPHTLRHTAAVTFLRNGGDVFALQRLLGHTNLEMTRRYCQLADTDVKKAHLTASPVDNMDLRARRKQPEK